MTSDVSILEGFIDRQSLAKQLRCCDRTIARYEMLPDGLPYLTVAGRKLYRIEAVREWLAKRERKPNQRRQA